MHFRLEVDLSKLSGDDTEELARALRFWAGNLRHYNFNEQPTETINDSEYKAVGSWSVS